MARRDRLDHTNSAGEDLGRRLARVGYAWRIAAENVAMGRARPTEILALWLASDGHRRNIFLADIDAAGLAWAGDPARPFWVLVVAHAARPGAMAPAG